MQQGEVSYGVGHVTVHVGSSLRMIGHPSQSDAPPHEVCPPTYL